MEVVKLAKVYKLNSEVGIDVGKFDLAKYEEERAIRLENADIKCLHSKGIPCTNPKKHIKVFKISAKQKSKRKGVTMGWQFVDSTLEKELSLMAKFDEDYHFKDAEIKSIESAMEYYKSDDKSYKQLQKKLKGATPERDFLKTQWEYLHKKHWGNCTKQHFLWFEKYLSCTTRRWLEYMLANGQLNKYSENYKINIERLMELRGEIAKELDSLQHNINDIIDERVRERKQSPTRQYKKISIGENFLRKLKSDWMKMEDIILNLSEENSRLRFYLDDSPNKEEIKKILGKE